MKKAILKFALVFGIVSVIATGCQKEKAIVSNTSTDDLSAMVAQVEPTSSLEASADLANGEIYMLNMGINENALVVADDIDAPEGPAGGNDSNLRDSVDDRKHIRAKSFIFCLRRLDLSDAQIAKIKVSLRAFEECKESAVKRARVIYANLKNEYKAKAERLTEAFKKGNITEAQYKAGMEELRKSFGKELRDLHLKEKLDEAFKNCMKELLGKLKLILTDKQWAAFVACNKH